MGVAASACEVVGVFLTFFGEVVFQPGLQGAGKRDDPVLRALSVVDDDGAADLFADASDFGGRFGQRACGNGGRRVCRRDVDGFASEGPVIGFERFRLVGEPAPVERFRPGDVEDVAGEPCHGADSLLKLPGREVGATAEALEEFLRG